MKAYFTKTPKLIQALFSDYTWCIAVSKKPSLKSDREIYLTFDDGPHPEITPWVLKLLNKYNARATFFCVGDNVLKYPEYFNQILEQEHRIGNHTFNHLNGWKTKNNTYFNNIERTEEIFREKREIIRKFKSQIPNPKSQTIKAKTQNSELKTQNLSRRQAGSKLFRPPYGKIKPNQAKKLFRMGYQIIMWDVLSADFDIKISKERALQNVLKHTQNGSIIVFHDSEKAFKNLEFTLPKVLEYYSKKGYIFKSL